MECGSYRGINLMEDEMKVMERVVDKKVMVDCGHRWNAVWVHERKGNTLYGL